MALMMKTSQKMALRSARLPVAARPSTLRPLRALPQPGPETPETSAPVTKPFPAEPFSPQDPLKLNTPFNAVGGVDGPAPTVTDTLGFWGAPEIVNGRLAMLGFVAALAAELSTGQTVAGQVQQQPTLIAGTFLLFIIASVIPAFRRGNGEFGPFTRGAELINGRAAMIGFAALLINEAIRHAPLFAPMN